MKSNNFKNLAVFLVAAVLLLALPLLLQTQGNAWVRIVDIALLYVLLALGLNIVVGYAGLLDLGYVAFFAIGAYLYALMGSPHLAETFPAFKAMFPNGVHTSLLIVLPLAFVLAGVLGVMLGAPTLRLRGDYLAIVTLGFGEIIRVFLNTLDHPVNITNGPKGLDAIDSIRIWGLNLGRPLKLGDYTISSVSLYYYLFLVLVIFTVIVSHRLQLSRVGRAWMAIHQHPQHEAAGLRHGRELRRHLRCDVRGLPGLRLARVLQSDGVGDDRRHGGAGRHRPPAGGHPGRGTAGRAA
jgi:branched-chain amino acid transport system permease protein